MFKKRIHVQVQTGKWTFSSAVTVDDFEEPERVKILVEQLLEPLFQNFCNNGTLENKLTVELIKD